MSAEKAERIWRAYRRWITDGTQTEDQLAAEIGSELVDLLLKEGPRGLACELLPHAQGVFLAFLERKLSPFG